MTSDEGPALRRLGRRVSAHDGRARVDEYERHPSIRMLMADGHQILTF